MPDVQMTSIQQQQSSDSMQDNNSDHSRAYVAIDMPSSQQQHSSDSTQNNNGNDRSLASTGVGAQEKSVLITVLLEMGAGMLGVLVCGWVVLVLVQGGMVSTVETKDRAFITVMFFLVWFRCWRYYCPQAPGSLTEATQSLSADSVSIQKDIKQLALPIRFIRRLFCWCKLVSAMTSVVLSVMRLASQDFGKTEVPNKGSRDFALNVFYGLTLAEALVLLSALTFSFTIMAILEVLYMFNWANPVQRNDCNSVEPSNGPADERANYSEGNVYGPVNYSDGAADGLRRRIVSQEQVELPHAIQAEDQRDSSYRKHYPPMLNDDVWRLEGIGKNGKFHQRLKEKNIYSVHDFLKLLNVNPSGIKEILNMQPNGWRKVVNHAQTCRMEPDHANLENNADLPKSPGPEPFTLPNPVPEVQPENMGMGKQVAPESNLVSDQWEIFPSNA